MGLCPPLPLEGVEGAGLVPRIDLQLVPTCIGQCHIIALEFQCLSRQIWRARRHQRSEFATFEAPPEGIWLALLGIRSYERTPRNEQVPANLPHSTSQLAPEIVGALLAGRHPIELTPTRLLRLSKNLPHDWKEQRRFLGFDA
jgi:hypothetical protein